MTRVLVLGGGKIGSGIVEMLQSAGDYQVALADQDPGTLAPWVGQGIETLALDVDAPGRLRAALQGRDVVINAGPYMVAPRIAQAARDAGVHYFDLTEDVDVRRRIEEIAESAETVLMPHCGLAPGFVCVAAHALAEGFDELHDVHMRVGALPQFPSNALKYNLTWSTEGLINEYCSPCEAIRDGAPCTVMPLEGKEAFGLDGVNYEAFNTSGGLGTLCETLAGKVRNLDYKTVRYPGHRDVAKLLIQDLHLGRRRHVLKDVLETALPQTLQDVVLVFITASGMRSGRLEQETFTRKVYATEIDGEPWSAIRLTTAAGVAAMLDMVRDGRLPDRGFVRQEQARLDDFLANRFGRYFNAPKRRAAA